MSKPLTKQVYDRLLYLRHELRAERISTGELLELQSLAEYIPDDDVELLEAAGVPEFPEEVTDKVRCNNCMAVFDEDVTECTNCKTDAYFMQPFTP